MARAVKPREALSDEDLEKVLGLSKDVASVELKLTIPELEQRSTVIGLGMDPLDAQIRQMFFFDTPDLALNAAGVVARARRVQGKGGDSVVKLRPVAPDELPDDVRRSPSVGLELDAMPGGYVCSASFKGRVDNADIRGAAAGERPIRKLFTKEQRRFFAAHAPGGIEFDDLSVLGPIFVLKLRFSPEGLAGGSSPSSGCTRTTSESSSSRRSASPPRPSRRPPSRAPTSRAAESICPASSRRRRRSRSSSSRSS